MVTINLTVIIELMLFLVFLWGTQRFILTPLLKSMDERGDSIERDVAKAKEDDQRAEDLEHQYRHEIAMIRRDADEEVRQAKQKSMQEHAEFLLKERHNAETAIAKVAAEAQGQVEAQRDTVLAQTAELMALMEVQLTASVRPSTLGGTQ